MGRERRPPSPALIAHEDGGLVVVAHDQEGLLEPGVEPGEVRQIGAVLAIGVDHNLVQSPPAALAQSLHAVLVNGVGDGRHQRDCRNPATPPR